MGGKDHALPRPAGTSRSGVAWHRIVIQPKATERAGTLHRATTYWLTGGQVRRPRDARRQANRSHHLLALVDEQLESDSDHRARMEVHLPLTVTD